MITPRTTSWKKGLIPSKTRPLPITVITYTPKTVPNIVPRPPDKAAPPITTPAITSNSKPLAALALPEPRRAVKRIADIEAKSPAVAKRNELHMFNINTRKVSGLRISTNSINTTPISRFT